MSVWHATQFQLPGANPRRLNTGDSFAAPRAQGLGCLSSEPTDQTVD